MKTYKNESRFKKNNSDPFKSSELKNMNMFGPELTMYMHDRIDAVLLIVCYKTDIDKKDEFNGLSSYLLERGLEKYDDYWMDKIIKNDDMMNNFTKILRSYIEKSICLYTEYKWMTLEDESYIYQTDPLAPEIYVYMDMESYISPAISITYFCYNDDTTLKNKIYSIYVYFSKYSSDSTIENIKKERLYGKEMFIMWAHRIKGAPSPPELAPI